MINVVKYGTIAALAIAGSLLPVSGAVATAALVGGIAAASQGVEDLCNAMVKKDETKTQGNLAALLRDNSKGKSLQDSRERAKKGMPPKMPRDKRIAGR